MDLDTMRERIAAALAEARTLSDKIDAEKRKATDEEKRTFDALMAEVDELKADVGRREKLEGEERWAKAPEHPEKRPLGPVRGSDGAEAPSLGVQMQAIARRSGYRGPISPEAEARAAGMNEAVGSQGGFHLETTYMAGLFNKLYDTSPIVSLCRKAQIGPNSNSLVIKAISETSRVAGSRFGGCTFYWLDEGVQKTHSQPAFRKIVLEPKKVAALWYATDELLQDAVALTSIANDVFGQELEFVVANAIINGTGAGQPLGIINSPALVTVAAIVGQGVDTIISTNVEQMWSRCWGPSRRNSVWLYNQDCEPQLHSMVMPGTAGPMPCYLPPNGLSASPFGTIYGRPAIPCEQCSTIGNVGDILLVDLNSYMLVDKGPGQMGESIHLRFDYDETTFRLVYRVDGSPLWDSVLTPATGSALTLSPFVALAAR